LPSVFDGGLQVRYAPLGHFEVTVGATAVGLPNIPNPERVRRIVIRPLGEAIVFTDDGTTPSASHGMPLLEDEILVYDGQEAEDFQMIRRAAADADVRVIYYGT
jgi:hypothetical protein